eukprot:COSAG01_NODE_1627_length_9684_cov_16.787063_1_plen_71_part_10
MSLLLLLAAHRSLATPAPQREGPLQLQQARHWPSALRLAPLQGGLLGHFDSTIAAAQATARARARARAAAA